MTPRRATIALAFTVAAAPREAKAQVHWDASAQVGVMKRFLADRPGSSDDDATFGPTGQLVAHVALLPLVHAGAYFGHDISPVSGDPAARNITFGGIRAKGLLPWFRGAYRAWLFAGFGLAGVYSQSYRTTLAVPDGLGGAQMRPALVQGAGGRFFEVPFGLGASYTIWRPVELCAELGARVGFAHTGSAYEGNGPQVSVGGASSQNIAPAGLDRFALGLTVGVLLDL
jgi:hypothetical protein